MPSWTVIIGSIFLTYFFKEIITGGGTLNHPFIFQNICCIIIDALLNSNHNIEWHLSPIEMFFCLYILGVLQQR